MTVTYRAWPVTDDLSDAMTSFQALAGEVPLGAMGPVSVSIDDLACASNGSTANTTANAALAHAVPIWRPAHRSHAPGSPEGYRVRKRTKQRTTPDLMQARDPASIRDAARRKRERLVKSELLAIRVDTAPMALDASVLDIAIAITFGILQAWLDGELIPTMPLAMPTHTFRMRKADPPATTAHAIEPACSPPGTRELGAQAATIAPQRCTVICPVAG